MTLESLPLNRQTFDDHPAIQLLVEADGGRIVEANAAAASFYGCERAQLRLMKLAELVLEPARDTGALLESLTAEPQVTLATVQCARGGERRHVEIDAGRVEGEDGRAYLYTVMRDVTAGVRSEASLRDYREIFEHLPIPFYRATRGATGRFVRFNQAFMELFEAETPEQLFECDVSSLYIDPHERERFSNALMQQGQVYRYEMQLRTLTGRPIWAIDTSYQHQDEDGNTVFDGVLEDVTRQRELEQELAYQARFDELTGLANRRNCDEALQAEIERCDRYGHPLSVLMFDLDHFKRINDERGHAEGDRVLERVADTTRRHVRQTDIAGRWGGEEFMVLLPETRVTGATQLADKLRRSIAAQGDDATRVTISVGCGEYVRGEGEDAFLSRLDEALYGAKAAGRNRVAVATSPDRKSS
ncbi:MAG: sensor domain-containing diguanylate cyclase [Halofilum sp. (in: g-proteobacteria)]|nr:sensor domain-containing diguanylate cyclase [Halofilum sp. (in: g-proteobacteria)]